MIASSTTVIVTVSSLLAIVTTAACVVVGLLSAFSRSRTQQCSRSLAVASLIFSNGLIGAVSLPMWIYLIYDYSENPTGSAKRELHIAFNVIDITLNVATCLQLLLISYEQLRTKAFQTQSKVYNAGTKCYLLITWIVGLVTATLHSLSSAKGIITTIIIIVLLLVPILFITICFVSMLVIKNNPNQQYGATTKTGLTVLSCFVCIVPSAVLMLLLHTKTMVPDLVMGYVVVLLRYVNPLSTTIIYGYKSMAIGARDLSCEKQGDINEVYDISMTETAVVAPDNISQRSLVV